MPRLSSHRPFCRGAGSWGQLPRLAIALLATGVSACPAPAAGPIVAPAGFEPTVFNTGSLVGQDDWLSATVGASTATVQSDVVESGSQAVRVDRAAGSEGRWAKFLTGFPTGQYVSVRWDMMVEPTGAPTGQFGPFMGVEAYDASGGNAAIFLLGSLGVDATTGDVLYQDAGTGVFVESGAVATFNQWNRFEIVLDYAADRYTTYFNGSEISDAGFVDGAFGLDSLTDVDLSALSAAADAGSVALTAVAYYDNFVVSDNLAGDYSGDGAIDAADYTVWRDQLGLTGPSLDADGDGDRAVTAADYDQWRDAYGGPTVALSAALPEPSTAWLAALALVSISRRRATLRRLVTAG